MAKLLDQRNYFYSIDLNGRLFLEETLPKNVATSIKDEKFLNFFFRQIRPIKSTEQQFLHSISITQSFGPNDSSAPLDYPFVSPCGSSERNFIRPADTPIVFHTIREIIQTNDDDNDNDDNDDEDHYQNNQELVFAGTLSQPFCPKNGGLALSKKSFRLYHKLISQRKKNSAHRNKQQQNRPLITTTPLQSYFSEDKNSFHGCFFTKEPTMEYGLIKSSLAVELSEYIIPNANNNSNNNNNDDLLEPLNLSSNEYSGMDYKCPHTGNVYPIQWLPEEAEPGPYALPTL